MKKGYWGMLLGGFVTAVSGYTYVRRMETQNLVIERVVLPLPDLPPALDGLTIVVMSDFHVPPSYKRIDLIQRAVHIANELQPDLIALPGDFVLYHVWGIRELAPILGQLQARLGVYATLGNHDGRRHTGMVQTTLEKAGISVLVNSGVLLTHQHAALYVAGVDDGILGYPDLRNALAAAPPDVPVILLAHEPDLADTFSLNNQIILQVSGHTHGGQIRLPMVGPLVLPEYGRLYHSGLYRVNQMWVYTTRGIGTNGPPFRFLCPPEITHLTLVAG